MDCSPPGSSLHGVSQARILEWVAISFSRGSSWPRDQTWISGIAGENLYHWATREAHVDTASRKPKPSISQGVQLSVKFLQGTGQIYKSCILDLWDQGSLEVWHLDVDWATWLSDTAIWPHMTCIIVLAIQKPKWLIWNWFRAWHCLLTRETDMASSFTCQFFASCSQNTQLPSRRGFAWKKCPMSALGPYCLVSSLCQSGQWHEQA